MDASPQPPIENEDLLAFYKSISRFPAELFLKAAQGLSLPLQCADNAGGLSVGSSVREDIEERKTALRIAVESSANATIDELVARARAFLNFFKEGVPVNTAASRAPEHRQTSQEQRESEQSD
jgi:hypothetical protein